MLMLKAVPPMNFARTDPGESVTQPVLSPNSISERYKGAGAALGGSVQNPDPSGACGGLFRKMNFTFHISVKCIDYIQSWSS